MPDSYVPAGPVDRACESDDELRSLRALRRKIAATLDATGDARTIASLSRQLVDVVARIGELREASRVDPGKPVAGGVLSSLEEFRARRAASDD